MKNQRHANDPSHADTGAISESELRGYIALWTAVLTQALMDAKSRRTKPEYAYIRNTALFWLLENKADFAVVCEFAGLDPENTRRLVREAQARGFCRWEGERKQRTKHDFEMPTELFDLGMFTCEVPTKPKRERRVFFERFEQQHLGI